MKDFGSICAVILAAGESKRFGTENKLLVELDGVSILERVVRSVLKGGIDKALVITGFRHEAIVSMLSRYDVECVQNPSWETGMGSSLATGASVFNEEKFTGLMVCLGDLPYLDSHTVGQIVTHFKLHENKKIVIPENQGRLGHPVVFPVTYVQKLSQLEGDEGAKSIIKAAKDDIEQVNVTSTGVFQDVDVPGDLHSFNG